MGLRTYTAATTVMMISLPLGLLLRPLSLSGRIGALLISSALATIALVMGTFAFRGIECTARSAGSNDVLLRLAHGARWTRVCAALLLGTGFALSEWQRVIALCMVIFLCGEIGSTASALLWLRGAAFARTGADILLRVHTALFVVANVTVVTTLILQFQRPMWWDHRAVGLPVSVLLADSAPWVACAMYMLAYTSAIVTVVRCNSEIGKRVKIGKRVRMNGM